MQRDRYLIEVDEMRRLLNDPAVRVFDASIMFYMGLSPEELAKLPTAYEQYLAGHIPGAAFFDHLEFSDANSAYEYMLAPDQELADQIGKIGITNKSQVIVYTTGILACATRAWWLLRYAGLENVRVLNGGLTAWKNAGEPVERGEQKYPAAQFKGHFNPEMIAHKEEVLAGIDGESVYTENSLSLEWHNREHIPGSSCLPLTDLMFEWDAFLPEEQLRARLNGTGQQDRIITYCGGGIAATVNAMAYFNGWIRTCCGI